MDDLLTKITALAKRRGYIFPSSEIYGGLANTYDFGPYGTELKENVRNLWWETFIRNRDDMYGIDSSVIMNPEVWKASGHVESFVEIMIEDTVNNRRYRADHIIEEYFGKKGIERKVEGLPLDELDKIIEEENILTPDGNKFSKARKISGLFETEIGILEDDKNSAYLRGEIAQGLFLNYKNIIDSIHPKLPFGIGQAGKVYRNEVSKGQLTHRTLEFDLMEFEYFFDPDEQNWNELFDYWKDQIYDFSQKLGIREENLRWRAHEEFELSHYSKRTEDLEYKYPWGYKELFASAYRTDFDLKNHQEKSGKSMEYIYPDNRRVIPHVIEPTFGLSRVITVLLIDAYREERFTDSNDQEKERVYLALSPKIAPVKAAVFPLQKDQKLEKLAKEIHQDIRNKVSGLVIYDNTGNIGKNYRRQDEIGTPYCITVDFDSLNDKMVTVRDRDSMDQRRVPIDGVAEIIKEKL